MSYPKQCRRSVPALLIALVSFSLASRESHASWATQTDVPVERLIANAQAYIDANPKDARGYYVLGRIHGLAYALNAKELGADFDEADKGKKLPNIKEHLQGLKDKDAKAPTKEQRHEHLRQSLANQFKAAEMFPSAALIHLGVASTLKDGMADAGAIGLPPGAPKLVDELSKSQRQTFERYVTQLGSNNEAVAKRAEAQLLRVIDRVVPVLEPHVASKDDKVRAGVGRLMAAHWKELAINHYLRAYVLSVEKDLRTKFAGLKSNFDLIGLVSYEAATEGVALAEARGVHLTERGMVKSAKLYLSKIKEKVTLTAVTPIVLCIDQPRELSAMIDMSKRVAFDLCGDGIKRHWPWPKPHAAFLVWDPQGTGRITSGRQLFGSVTWWMFWHDGYHALDALDNNRDGEIRDDELVGLALWFDRNSNGISDPGEVQSVTKHGITSLFTKSTSLADDKRSPASSQGVSFRDGRRLPTVDWIVESVK